MRLRGLCVLVCVLAAPVAAWALLPVASAGSTLQDRIDRATAGIDAKKRREGVLTTDISAATARIDALQREITGLEARQNRIQADLDAKRAELARIQDELRRQRARLARLKARLAHGRAVLAVRLRQIYTSDQPDIVTVILNANGFADLLERGEFLRRINDQDRRIIAAVRAARDQTQATTDRLAELEAREQRVAAAITARRDEVARVKDAEVAKRVAYAHARARKADALAATRESRRRLEEDVQAMEAQQSRIQAQLGSGDSGVAGPVRHGSGQLIWPVDGPITAPFCERRAWEACHPGIDIGAATGTPIRAAAAGVVKIASSYGGYGNYTCVQHAGSLSTCYGHQSAFAVGVGQSVGQGEVIGYVGCTGLCFGSHLHFEVRIDGSVVDPMGYL